MVESVSLRAWDVTSASEIYVDGLTLTTVSSNAPTILTQPESLTLAQGSTALFTVSGSSAGPISYQWSLGGINLIGSTNATLLIQNARLAQAGDYQVSLSNCSGSTNSNIATLTVINLAIPPVITQQPSNVTTNLGAAVTFGVAATGTTPLTYQWQFNGQNLSGATTARLTLPGVQTNQGGSYDVVVANAAGSVTSSNATLLVLSGPNVWMTLPTNGASFAAGAAIELAAAASDAQGTVTQVQFFQGGTNLLGIATNAPQYTVRWSNVPSGNYTLSARATDNYGLSSTSPPVSIVVTNSPTPGLAVSILSPASSSSFCPGDDVLIDVAVSIPTGAAEVKLFAGGTLLRTFSASPYSFTWAAPQPGTYTLSASAADGLGNTVISSNVEVFVTSQCGVVAIVRSVPNVEVGTLQSYLFNDQGFGSHVYDQGGLTAQALEGYKLVIWYDAGLETNAVTPGTVDALWTAYTNGIPIYLIGERLASGTTNLPEPQRSEWAALTRLSASSGLGTNGMITVQSSLAYNPILDGFFGTVTNFPYPGQLDLATNVDANTEVLGTSGGADVLLAYPGFQIPDTGQTRLFTQGLPAVPADAAGSTNVLRALFENTVLWLLREGWCTDVAIYVDSTNSPSPAQVGQLLEYDLGISRGGECDATGLLVTNVLPAGVQFVSARCEQGSWSYDAEARQVIFSFGYFDPFSKPSMIVTVMPVAAGTATNVTGARFNGTAVNPGYSASTNVVEVLPGPDLAPTLGIRLVSPNVVELSLNGVANVAYEVQFSPDLKTWTTVAIVLGPQWEIVFTPGSGGSPAGGFYRAGLGQ